MKNVLNTTLIPLHKLAYSMPKSAERGCAFGLCGYHHQCLDIEVKSVFVLVDSVVVR